MKHLTIMLLLVLTSCNSKTNEEVKLVDKTIEKVIENIKTADPKIEFKLIDAVLKNLNIKKENCKLDLVVLKENPNNPEETIIVIPEIVDEGEHYFELNSYILIVASETGEIINTYFESYKTNDWVSDALRLTKITIDTAPYIVSENFRAFGIRVHYYGSSWANPYNRETISLYIPTGDSLIKIVDNYKVMGYNGAWNADCVGEFISEKKVLIMTKEKTNGYFNISVKNKIIETKNFLDENNDCDSTEKIRTEKTVLTFNKKEYN